MDQRRDDRGSTGGGFLGGIVLTLAAVLGADALGLVRLDLGDPAPPVTAPEPAPVVPASADPDPAPSATPPATTAPPVDAGGFAEVYSRVSSGVVRLESTGCGDEGIGTGTGFLVDDDLLVTAAHVVEGHSSLQLLLGEQTASGSTVGYWPEQDLALVRSSRPFTGHLFELKTDLPPIGTEVAALGYPLSGSLSLAGPGVVSAYGETVTYEGPDGTTITVDDLMRSSVPINRGNSGGPLVDSSGAVVGVISGERELRESGGDVDVVDGFKFAVTSTTVGSRLDQQAPLAPLECEAPSQPAPQDLVTALTDSPDTTAAMAVFFDYFDGINRSDYERAYRQLDPARRENLSLEQFQEEQSTSTVSNVVVLETSRATAGLRVLATFQSFQDPAYGPDGLGCALWVLDYTFVPGGEHGWYIAASTNQPDRPKFEPCT